jgi:hypothetical protein
MRIRIRCFWLLIACMVTARAQEVEQRSFGVAQTARATNLLAAPAVDGTVLRFLSSDEPLRWVEGERRNGFLRVVQERGPIGWAAEADLKNMQPPLPVVSPEPAVVCASSLAQCPTLGCATAGSTHALLNRQKRRAALAGATRVLSFADFKGLQQQAENLVGQAQQLDAQERGQLQDLHTSAGLVAEGRRVRLAGFIAAGPGAPRANSGGESVNCQLSGANNNDFHISIVPRVGDTEWQGIVVEMVPQGRAASWTLANLRKARTQKRRVLVTGPLFYDNAHTVNDDPQSSSNQPKRFSLWEIHRVTSFKVCLRANNDCDPERPAEWGLLASL